MQSTKEKIEYGVLIKDREHLRQALAESRKQHYTYILREPGGKPFYVGIGQGLRMFSHVEEAKDPERGGLKVEAIRNIWSQGGEVLHTIDGWHDNEPWVREAELIEAIGQIKHGTGPLTNAQDYSPSHVVAGVEVRKYKDVQGEDVNGIPETFKLKDVRLMAGPREPKTRRSVFGKIYTALEENPGVTGSELVSILLRLDFSSNKSAYTQSGAVCAAWVCGYIEGGYFRSDTQYIQSWKNKR
ncbi:hypothetical protein SAMN05421693_1451 [Ectothiorhodospira magna]|uniref:GIY-YIG domain-containing protein n=1 Tax=Ectothiorhodospira magna TaxID=867345 RepID=A0A1H9GQF5_9GAMM|nr:GIY-YIG nuclease family protein [Ectothiorhodospira magna]SEQ52273.1 hypothetical protein SAMN05421693_1451 [Ectothiorhodospira magna]